jgi:hypothetical protein
MFHRTTILAALALAISAAFTAMPAANAAPADSPTVQQLLDQCALGRTDYCQFKPSGNLLIFSGPRQFAGSSTNCTNFNQTRVIRYEASTGTKNTFGVEISATVKLGEVFEASIKTSFQREWSWEETKVDEIRQDVGKKARVDIFVVKAQARVNGTWELHFGSRYYGHYYWYVNGQVSGQTKGQPWNIRAEQRKASC